MRNIPSGQLKAKIIGAGSVGNHLANACRRRGWMVTLSDIDNNALLRSKNLIYPSRYGKWDPEIVLKDYSEVDNVFYDAIFIGTPPITHIPLAVKEGTFGRGKIILIEKPLGAPNLSGLEDLINLAAKKSVKFLCGYNHRVSKVVSYIPEFIESRDFGEVFSIRARTREHWAGILNAHPWLDSPQNSYLGSMIEGGGALLEHSHSLNLFMYFCELLRVGRVTHVSAMQDLKTVKDKTYDQNSQLSLRTESGCFGLVEQDVISKPSEKSIEVTAERGNFKITFSSNLDILQYEFENDQLIVREFPKKREDDFISEVKHIENLLRDSTMSSPLDLEHAISTMIVINGAIESNLLRKEISLQEADID